VIHVYSLHSIIDAWLGIHLLPLFIKLKSPYSLNVS